MVSGVHLTDVNNVQYNAILKGKNKQEKRANNIKYTAAAGALLGAGTVAGKAILDNPNNAFVKRIDKDLTKGAEFLANGGLKKVYAQTADKAKNIYQKAKTHIPENQITNKLAAFFGKAKSAICKAFGKAKEVAAPVINKIKPSLAKAASKLKNFATTALNKFAKLPGKYKAIGLIGALVLTSVLALTEQKGYNNGKIDQKYADAAKM